jgi:hypothetical protein
VGVSARGWSCVVEVVEDVCLVWVHKLDQKTSI